MKSLFSFVFSRERWVLAIKGLKALVAVMGLGALVWFGAPLVVDDPLPAVKARTPVRVWKDRTGRILHYERTYNYEWRFDIPLSDVAP